MQKSSAALNLVASGGEVVARIDSATAKPDSMRCPESELVRGRLRAMASDLVSVWRCEGIPPTAKTANGLRSFAEALVKRASAAPEHVGWTMVTIVSEFWRERLARAPSGRRLLLLPHCPAADPPQGAADEADAVPRVCGPGCGIATIWSAAREGGWVVEPVARAVAGIGSLLTGQYDGVLGLARLPDLEKAFAMLPAFSLPVAAVPFETLQPTDASGSDAPRPKDCAAALAASAIDVSWVLGLLGVAGSGSASVGDYLPLLRESAEMFWTESLTALSERLALGPVFGSGLAAGGHIAPLDATASMAGAFLARGGKFLRPFICLAAYDAVRSDQDWIGGDLAASDQKTSGRNGQGREDQRPNDRGSPRDSAKAASVAIEIFHKASLVHDDIEDGDLMRYGQPALHVDRGVPAAINVGDYLLGLGYRIVSGLPGVDAATLRDVVAILADAHVRLAQGQGAELWWRDGGDKRLSPDEALAIYGLKTSPAFEAAVAMGIRLAGLEPSQAGEIASYALHVGTGFQVLNDLKDWSGDLENNRRAAGDLLGGRPTVMWALAIERLPVDAAARLRELARSAGRAEAGEAEIVAAVAEARLLYAKAGVFERAAEIVTSQRALAAGAAATCRWRRLRDVLEFLLDLAVPETAAAQFSA